MNRDPGLWGTCIGRMRERPPEKFANKGKEKDKNEGKGAGSIVSSRCKTLEAESGDEQLYVNTLKEVGEL